jgi:hypothetical protein
MIFKYWKEGFLNSKEMELSLDIEGRVGQVERGGFTHTAAQSRDAWAIPTAWAATPILHSKIERREREVKEEKRAGG